MLQPIVRLVVAATLLSMAPPLALAEKKAPASQKALVKKKASSKKAKIAPPAKTAPDAVPPCGTITTFITTSQESCSGNASTLAIGDLLR